MNPQGQPIFSGTPPTPGTPSATPNPAMPSQPNPQSIPPQPIMSAPTPAGGYYPSYPQQKSKKPLIIGGVAAVAIVVIMIIVIIIIVSRTATNSSHHSFGDYKTLAQNGPESIVKKYSDAKKNGDTSAESTTDETGEPTVEQDEYSFMTDWFIFWFNQGELTKTEQGNYIANLKSYYSDALDNIQVSAVSDDIKDTATNHQYTLDTLLDSMTFGDFARALEKKCVTDGIDAAKETLNTKYPLTDKDYKYYGMALGRTIDALHNYAEAHLAITEIYIKAGCITDRVIDTSCDKVDPSSTKLTESQQKRNKAAQIIQANKGSLAKFFVDEITKITNGIDGETK